LDELNETHHRGLLEMMRSIEELEVIYSALDAMPLDEKMARLANACLEMGKGLPASVFLVIMSTVLSNYLSQNERDTLARFMRDAIYELNEQTTQYIH
jgi:hypothetical protein